MNEQVVMAVEGFVERVSAERIGGWCFDPDEPEHHHSIDLILDGKLIATEPASRTRKDLANAGKGAGDHGFVFELTPPLGAAALDRVIVRARTAAGVSSQLRRLGSAVTGTIVEPARRPFENLLDTKISRCVLHIGTEKTGTSSLQTYLAMNREGFREQGILVPRACAPHAQAGLLNHVFLATYAMDVGAGSHSLRADYLVSGREAVGQHRQDIVSALQQEIGHNRAGCRMLLFSSEHCSSRLHHVEELKRLRNLLRSFCDKVEVVIYVRPQHEVAVSSRSTMLKSGAISVPALPTTSFDSVSFLTKAGHYYDYDALVAKWEGVFGEAAMHVRLYPRDIVADFCARLPVDMASFKPLNHRHNVGLDPVAESVLGALNRAMASLGRPQTDRIRPLVLQTLIARHSGCGGQPSRQDAMAFQAMFDEGNARLAARYHPGLAGLLSHDFSMYPEHSTVAEPTVAEMAAVFVEILQNVAEAGTSGTT